MQTLDYDTQPVTAEHVTDAAITAAVELFFLTKKGVPAHLIDVSTHEGIVTLTGITDNLLARERAEEITLLVRGVRGVVNELLISMPDVPDEELNRHLATALADDPATADYNVQATAVDGVATVTGVVQSWAEKQLVLRVLRGVRGVRRLHTDDLIIRWGEVQNSDAEITTQIRELLDWDIRVHSALVEIRTNDRVVHLSGTVGSASEKAQVEATAHQAGASRVDARDLFVAYWAQSPELRRHKYADRSDEAIAAAVRAAFRYDPRVLSYQPTIVVHHGIVTLSGAVSNLRAKQAAERDARDVVGVWDVHNLLKVRTTRFIPDLNITHSIEQALARDPYVGFFDFSVYVRNGSELGYTTLIDTTEHEELKASLKRLYDGQESILHLVAHDLKAPIAHIQLLTELLHRTANGSPTETPKFLAMIQQCCDEARALLQDVLYLGALDATQLKKEPTNLNAFLDTQLSVLRLAAQEKGIALTLALPPHVVTAPLNPNKFGRVVVNLLTNALKFTPAGGRVTVRLEERAGRPRLSVQDTGVGIAPELQAHVFDKFSTAARAGLYGEETTGLGLFITQQIVRLHGGTIRLESRENEGTTFFIDL